MANIPVRGPLFSPEWQARYAPVVERSMIASGVVYRPNDDPDVYDSDTDTWIPAPREVVYSGKMRVQPLRTASRRDAPGNTTEVQTFLFSVPHTVLGDNLRPGMIVEVDNGGLNPDLLGFDYRVVEVTDSSNPLEKTFYAVVNQERELNPTPTPELITYRWLGEPHASPSQEVAPDGTVLRTNYVLNPKFVDNADWSVNANGEFAGDGLVEVTGSAGMVTVNMLSAAEVAGPGEQWSGSGVVSVPVGYSTVRARLGVYTYSGTAVGLYSPYQEVAPGESLPIHVTAPLSVAGNAGVRLLAQIEAGAVGRRMQISEPMLCKALTAFPYFDGDTAPRPA